MVGIYRYQENQPISWFDRNPSRSNQYCLYCGCFVGNGASAKSNKEHLIGRDFVPTGEFGDGTQFNFIFRSCASCNNQKSEAERHVSSVTLFNSPARALSSTHDRIAQHKGKSDYHPYKKGVPVKYSGDKFSLHSTFGPAQISFGLSGPPQLYAKFTEFLAFKHIQGLFSLITSKDPCTAAGTMLLSGQYFSIYEYYIYRDWGNPQLVEIMNRARKIPCYANIETANGFFKAIMRKDKCYTDEWFWALEWNKSLRVVGAISSRIQMPCIFKNLPSLGWTNICGENGHEIRLREERAIDSESDTLFSATIEDPAGT